MNALLRSLIRDRAGNACEYCLLPQSAYRFRFPIDHVIAIQHGGRTTPGNLCLACPRCNAFKGPNLSGIDPKSRRLVALFNPRRHTWRYHFKWQEAVLSGRTPKGRATVTVLCINEPSAVALREELIAEGLFPPIQSE